MDIFKIKHNPQKQGGELTSLCSPDPCVDDMALYGMMVLKLIATFSSDIM